MDASGQSDSDRSSKMPSHLLGVICLSAVLLLAAYFGSYYYLVESHRAASPGLVVPRGGGPPLGVMSVTYYFRDPALDRVAKVVYTPARLVDRWFLRTGPMPTLRPAPP